VVVYKHIPAASLTFCFC